MSSLHTETREEWQKGWSYQWQKQTGVKRNRKRMEKTVRYAGGEALKTVFSRKHARKGKSRLGLSHRKKGSPTT